MFDACHLTAIEPQPDGRLRLVLVAVDAGAGEKVAQDVLVAGVVTQARVEAEARRIVTDLNANRVSAKGLTLGPVNLAPPVPTKPLPDPDPARTKFIADWHRYQNEQRAKLAGMPVVETVTQAELAAAWQADYVGLI